MELPAGFNCVMNDKKHILGRGTYGVVYKGYLSNSSKVRGTPVAIKEVSLTRMKGEDIRETAVLQQLRKLNCPNLLQLLGFKITGTHLHIFTEFCDMGDLRQLMKRYDNRIPEKIVQQIAAQIVTALAVLHNNAIIHRDLKPLNIFLHSNSSPLGFEVKVGDFGASRFFGGTPFDGTRCGTLQYFAPEMKMRGQPYDEKVDYYSLGIVLTELMTGRISRLWDPQVYRKNPEVVLRTYKISPAFFSLQDGLLKQNPRERITLDKIQTHPFIVGEGEVETVLCAMQVPGFVNLEYAKWL